MLTRRQEGPSYCRGKSQVGWFVPFFELKHARYYRPRRCTVHHDVPLAAFGHRDMMHGVQRRWSSYSGISADICTITWACTSICTHTYTYGGSFVYVYAYTCAHIIAVYTREHAGIRLPTFDCVRFRYIQICYKYFTACMCRVYQCD